MAVDTLFEGPTPLARRLRDDGPYADGEAMIAHGRELIGQLSEAEKIETVNAHPRIGEDPAQLSSLSLAEQGSDRVPELESLNATYEERFGFRFVVFVAGRSKAEIVAVLRERLRNDREAELETAVRAVVDIAAARLAR